MESRQSYGDMVGHVVYVGVGFLVTRIYISFDNSILTFIINLLNVKVPLSYTLNKA